MGFEIMSLKGLLRPTELLMLDAHKVFDGIGIQMFSACLSVGESEVTDEIIGANVFLVGPPMLFECIRGVKGDFAVGAKASFVLAGSMCDACGFGVERSIALRAEAVGVSFPFVIFEAFGIDIVPLAVGAVAVQMNVIVLPVGLAGLFGHKISVAGFAPDVVAAKSHV